MWTAPVRSCSRLWHEDRREHDAGAADDDRHGRPGARVCEADDARRARTGAHVGGETPPSGCDRRTRLEPSRRRPGCRGARPSSCRRPGGGPRRRPAAHRRRWGDERRLPTPGANRRSRRLRVRVRNPGNRRRWCLDERRRVRQRLVADPRPGARRHRGRSGLADAGRARALAIATRISGTDRSSPKSNTASRLVRRRRSRRRSAN